MIFDRLIDSRNCTKCWSSNPQIKIHTIPVSSVKQSGFILPSTFRHPTNSSKASGILGHGHRYRHQRRANSPFAVRKDKKRLDEITYSASLPSIYLRFPRSKVKVQKVPDYRSYLITTRFKTITILCKDTFRPL